MLCVLTVNYFVSKRGLSAGGGGVVARGATSSVI